MYILTSSSSLLHCTAQVCPSYPGSPSKQASCWLADDAASYVYAPAHYLIFMIDVCACADWLEVVAKCVWLLVLNSSILYLCCMKCRPACAWRIGYYSFQWASDLAHQPPWWWPTDRHLLIACWPIYLIMHWGFLLIAVMKHGRMSHCDIHTSFWVTVFWQLHYGHMHHWQMYGA